VGLGIVNYGRPSVATSECLFEGLCTAVLAHFIHDVHAGLQLADLEVHRCVCACARVRARVRARVCVQAKDKSKRPIWVWSH
jgi:hypothetical protein